LTALSPWGLPLLSLGERDLPGCQWPWTACCEKIVLVQIRDDDLVTLSLPAQIWAGIDGGVDNAVSTAAEDGDEATVQVGMQIRRTGGDQVPWVDGAWPPMDQVISIRLTRAEWMFVAEEARSDIPVYEELGDEVSAQLGRDALAVIESALS
jgi:hypothetical protein